MLFMANTSVEGWVHNTGDKRSWGGLSATTRKKLTGDGGKTPILSPGEGRGEKDLREKEGNNPRGYVGEKK